MRVRTTYVATVADKLAAMAKSSPPVCDPKPVKDALNQLTEGLSSADKPHTLTETSLADQGLAPKELGFLKDHVPVILETAALQPDLFDPFPLDRQPVGSRPMPLGCFDQQASLYSTHPNGPTIEASRTRRFVAVGSRLLGD